ncbi:MAG: alkaline shock response membrane anchor protein AmaP [Candidatus Omnitrophota bacterium]|nr:MAG: alkaline shock response membrane anchor protein AmaP [Candidatus Omnitrophota bacterium]
MRALAAIVIFVCTLVFAALGGILVALSLDLFTLQNLTDFLRLAFEIENINLIVGGSGLFLIIASICIAQISFGRMQREKTIAFDNPDGQVSVSLSAIEDFIKRLSSGMSEVKDLRSNVVAGKKGIEINVRVSLWADANIPESTESIQAIIKNRIQEMLGIEETIIVKVHVGKIVPKEKRRFKKKGKEKEKEDVQTQERFAPFQGNIEYGD